MKGCTFRATCLLIALTIGAAAGCSTQQQERVAFYQPVIPQLQRDAANPAAAGLFAASDSATGTNLTTGIDRWQHGFTWNSASEEH
jgi:hypothetical protein